MSVRNPLFSGTCHLCGQPTANLYCVAHDWAAGDFRSPDPVVPLTLTELHGYWLERHTPEQIVHLAASWAA